MNEWQVYEFCKNNRGFLLALDARRQMRFLMDKLPDVERHILYGGLIEFRSVPAHNWKGVQNEKKKQNMETRV